MQCLRKGFHFKTHIKITQKLNIVMNSKRSENLIGHATINSIRSRKFFPLSCIKRDFATPKMFPIEAAEAKKLSSTIEWKYLY